MSSSKNSRSSGSSGDDYDSEEDSGSDYEDEDDRNDSDSDSDADSEEDDDSRPDDGEESSSPDGNSSAVWGNSSYNSSYDNTRNSGSNDIDQSGKTRRSSTGESSSHSEIGGGTFSLFSRKKENGGGFGDTIAEEDPMDSYDQEPEQSPQWGDGDDNDSNDSRKRRENQREFCSNITRDTWIYIGVGIGVLLLIIIVVIIIVTVGGGGGGGDDDSNNRNVPTISPAPSVSVQPSTAPTSSAAPTISPAPTVSMAPTQVAPTPRGQPIPIEEFVTDAELFALITSSSVDDGSALLFDDSPQHLAYLWLQNQDQLQRRLGDYRKVQRYRLMAFYFGSNGDTDWINKGRWGSVTYSECNWDYGQPAIISCASGSVVTGLEMENNGMTGQLVPEIGEITSLQTLVLDNSATDDMGMTGGIPNTFKDLVNIRKIKIVGNAFTQTLQDDLFTKWTFVKNINLGRNGIPGPIPSSIAGLDKVEQFNLGNNGLTGNIPNSISGMKSMHLFVLAKNNLNGPIPGQLSTLTRLKTLKLNGNGLTGNFPNIASLIQLKGDLDLSDNNLGGPLPNIFDSFPDLWSLKLQNNGFTGPLPPTMVNLSKIRRLDLSGNPGLRGIVPVSMCNNINQRSSMGLGDSSARVECINGIDTSSDQCNDAAMVCCECCECGGT